jgi:hypothetical protein
MTGHLFTPQVSRQDETRLYLQVSAEDIAKVRSAKPKGQYVVTDLETGKRFLAERAPCGLGCYCASVVIKELL